MADNTKDQPPPEPQGWSPPGDWRDPTSQSNDFWTNLSQAMGQQSHPQGEAQQQVLAAAGWTPQPPQAAAAGTPDLQQLAQLLRQQRQAGPPVAVPGLLGY